MSACSVRFQSPSGETRGFEMTEGLPAILAGDIGGTKTILALYSPEASDLKPLWKETYSSQSFEDLESILDAFRHSHPEPIGRAALATAGPVLGDRATVTNLPWTIEARSIEARFSIPRVLLLNDLEALATVVPHLEAVDLRTLAGGRGVPGGVIAVMAPGTGLGQAFLTRSATQYVAHPSEGGHSDFAPTDEVQIRLLRYLLREFPHVSVERVCSGGGIPYIYRFLRDDSGFAEESEMVDRLAEVDDPTPLIIQTAVDRRSRLCVRTLEMFAAILGAEAGNLALKLLSTGGVYLGGGIPPRVLPFLEGGGFLNAFVSKGRFASFLAGVPIHVILNSDSVLHGAALRASRPVAG